jgi:hypothetical protein
MTDIIDRLKQRLATIKDRVAAAIGSDERRDDDDFTAMVTAKLRPRPYRGSGAIALREPD